MGKSSRSLAAFKDRGEQYQHMLLGLLAAHIVKGFDSNLPEFQQRQGDQPSISQVLDEATYYWDVDSITWFQQEDAQRSIVQIADGNIVFQYSVALEQQDKSLQVRLQTIFE
jgi:hypothetical protein